MTKLYKSEIWAKSLIKICKYMFLHLSIFHFLPFCDSDNTDSFMTIQFWTKSMKKLVRNYQKSAEKKMIKKIETVRYYELLDHTFSDQNYSKVCKFCTYTTSHSFFNYFSLIFQICTVQWLNCTNLKYERNRCYNGGGVVYVLKRELSRSAIQYGLYIRCP